MGLVSKPWAYYGTVVPVVRHHAPSSLVMIRIGNVKSRDCNPCILHAYLFLLLYALRTPWCCCCRHSTFPRTISPVHGRPTVPYGVPPTWEILHLSQLDCGRCAKTDPCSRARSVFCRYAVDISVRTVQPLHASACRLVAGW